MNHTRHAFILKTENAFSTISNLNPHSFICSRAAVKLNQTILRLFTFLKKAIWICIKLSITPHKHTLFKTFFN